MCPIPKSWGPQTPISARSPELPETLNPVNSKTAGPNLQTAFRILGCKTQGKPNKPTHPHTHTQTHKHTDTHTHTHPHTDRETDQSPPRPSPIVAAFATFWYTGAVGHSEVPETGQVASMRSNAIRLGFRVYRVRALLPPPPPHG